jgi:S1-C subfamily serine protease
MIGVQSKAYAMMITRHQTARGIAFLLIFLLALVGPVESYAAMQAPDSEEEPTVRVYRKVAPATILIASAYLPRHHLSSDRRSGIGSGVILDEKGEILTNAHVVEGASKIMVILHDGTRLPAEVVGSDQVSDIALLRVRLPSGKPYAVAVLGDSDHVQIGQKVLAIGHPFGLGYALTTGVISGFGATPDKAGIGRERVIQTSAAVNPGNSGGPLVDLEGRVIGITNAVLIGAQNIGFAIPINAAKEIMAELRDQGHIVRPWLGISGTWLPDEVIDLFALPLAKGFLVEDVDEGSPAEKVGLKAGTLNVTLEGGSVVLGGDIIKTVDGVDVMTPEQFAKVFKRLKVGQTIELDTLRNGERRTITMTLQELPRSRTPQGRQRATEKVELRPSELQHAAPVQWSTRIRF